VQREAVANETEFGDREPEERRDLRGIASALTDIYKGAENAFEHIAKHTGEGLPSGADWHKQLLDQMQREAKGKRPAVIGNETCLALEAFRKFRHKERHLYGFDLQWDQVRPLAKAAESTVDLLVADLETFCQWLDALGADAA